MPVSASTRRLTFMRNRALDVPLTSLLMADGLLVAFLLLRSGFCVNGRP